MPPLSFIVALRIENVGCWRGLPHGDECARADRNYRAPLAAYKFQNLRIFSGVRSRAEPAGHNKQIKSWRFLQDAIGHNLQPVAAADILGLVRDHEGLTISSESCCHPEDF